MLDKLKIFKNIIRNFPYKKCVIPDNKERDIYYGDSFYWCLIKYKKDEEYIIKLLKPYINKYENDIYYGWVDKHGNTWDNKTKPIHNDDYEVIGIMGGN